MSYRDSEMDDTDRAELNREFAPRKRRSADCTDRMCGAMDCRTCRGSMADDMVDEDEQE